MAFCQLGSAQFSLSNWACTDLLTLEGSPWASATVDSTGLPAPDAGALDDGEGEALDAGDGLADGEGLDDGESFAPSRLAPRAWVCPLALGEAFGDAVAFAFPLPLALAEGVGVGVGAVGLLAPGREVFDASSRTCRNRSWAVVPTRFTTSF